MKNKEGKEEPWKRGKKEMNNKEGKEEPWKRGKKGMNNREGKEGSWKRGKKGMKTKEGKEEPWKRGKAKPEKRTKGWPIKRGSQKRLFCLDGSQRFFLCVFFLFK